MIFLRLPLLLTLLCGAGTLSLFATEPAAVVRVVGSDFLQNPLQDALVEFANSAGLDVESQFHGSLPAMDRVRQDSADLAIIAVADENDLRLQAPLDSLPLAYQVAAVLVHQDNPMMEISLRQLGGIFGTSPELQFSRWSELGVAGSVRSIQPMLLDAEHSTALELFKFKALRGSAMKSSVRTFRNRSSLIDAIGSDAGAIAISNQIPQAARIKVLSVSTGQAGDFAFGPTRENIYYGDYPLRVPFLIVYNREKLPILKPFITFLMSDEIAEMLTGKSFVTLPENVRRRALMELDN